MEERKPNNPEPQGKPDEEKMPKALFELGEIFITPGALITVDVNEQHPVQFLARHVVGDWGNLHEEDIETNRRSLKHNGSILSVYDLDSGGRIYIITEWDRSVTTLLTPDEY